MAQSAVDTLYYDKSWKGVQAKEFAAFYRIVPKSSDPNFRKIFRSYYITGELQAEGGYVTIDKYDDSKSVLADEVITYYKNGNQASKATYMNGKINGTYEEFTEDGAFGTKYNYVDGKPSGEHYTMSNKDGSISGKVSLATGKTLLEPVTDADRQLEYKDGEAWSYYKKNGIIVSMTNKEVNDYGKYYQLPIAIINNSVEPLDFDPEKIKATLVDNKGKIVAVKVLSSAEYMKKVDKSQSWAKVWNGLAEGLAASDAGYSHSTTTTSYHSNTSRSSSQSYGSHTTNRQHSGSHSSGSMHSTTRTYNAGAAYQAQVVASERIAAYNHALDEKREERQSGYLRHSTIYPGESVAGYVNVERKKGATLTVQLLLDDIIYTFPWDVSKK